MAKKTVKKQAQKTEEKQPATLAQPVVEARVEDVSESKSVGLMEEIERLKKENVTLAANAHKDAPEPLPEINYPRSGAAIEQTRENQTQAKATKKKLDNVTQLNSKRPYKPRRDGGNAEKKNEKKAVGGKGKGRRLQVAAANRIPVGPPPGAVISGSIDKLPHVNSVDVTRFEPQKEAVSETGKVENLNERVRVTTFKDGTIVVCEPHVYRKCEGPLCHGELKPMTEVGWRRMSNGTIRSQPQCSACRSHSTKVREEGEKTKH